MAITVNVINKTVPNQAYHFNSASFGTDQLILVQRAHMDATCSVGKSCSLKDKP